MNAFDRSMAAAAALCVLALALVFAGDAIERVTGVQAAVLFAFTILAVAFLLLATGVVAGRRGTPLRVLIGLDIALLATIVASIAHLESSDPAQDPSRLLGMLPSTALLLFGVFGSGMLCVVLVAAFFRRSVFGHAEEDRLAREAGSGEARGPDG